MCNDYRLEVDVASIMEDFDDLQIKIKMPEGAPNVPAREDVRITDIAPIVKASEGDAVGDFLDASDLFGARTKLHPADRGTRRIQPAIRGGIAVSLHGSPRRGCVRSRRDKCFRHRT